MARCVLLLFFLVSACGGIAANTKVAESYATRQAMATSVVIGQTTETGLVTRWGRPVQKVREGGQVEYIYRDILDQPPGDIVKHGDSTRYVIVTFQYGIAVGVRTSDDEGCRATFQPRPPGMNWDNPFTVYPLPTCPGLYRPAAGAVPPVGGQPVAGGPPGAGDPLGAGDLPVAGDPILADDPYLPGALPK